MLFRVRLMLSSVVIISLLLLLSAADGRHTAQASASGVVISKVYGGGGNSGSTYTHDFIEVFNAGSSPVNLNGWSVQYASAAGTTWQVTNLTNTTLSPGQYYLIQEAQGSGGTTSLPSPDATGSIGLSASSGKVALVTSTAALSGSCPGGIEDLVGYGTTATCFEGSGAAPGLSSTNAAVRGNGGCNDANNNSADFGASAAYPNAHNTASPLYSCSGGSGTWTPGNLEIHVLNVGQGESQLIIGPTGRTLLIGVFEPSWNTNQGAVFTASEIRRITGGSHVNYIMPSHWHLDHMGYAGYGGIWSLLEQQGITADAIIDRDGGVWSDTNNDNICDPDLEVVWHNAGTVSGTGRNWVCWATNPNTAGGAIRQLAQLNSTTQIDLGLGSGVTTKIVGVDANGVMQADGVTPVSGDHTGMSTPPSENDYSITIWINWGQFDFVAGGDTDGEYATSEFGYTYNDVESVVAARINQAIEAAWVNHHGSSHSSEGSWITTLSPQVVAFSCGSTNTYGHPGQDVLDSYNSEGTEMYFTQQCDPTRNYYDSRFINGNVEIKVTDGVNYTVNGEAYVASDPAPPPTPTPIPTPTPTPPPAPRAPVSGEVKINEFLPAPSVLFTTEWVELYNMTSDALDIGGLWIDDIKNGGGSPQEIPAGTILAPNGFYVLEVNNYLNNSSDTVRLLATNGNSVWDSRSYSSWDHDKSWCRTPDGGSTWVGPTCNPTKGSSN